jgi:hypothetical protein
VGCSPLETAAPAELSSSCYWQLWLAQNACGFQNFLLVRLGNEIMQETGRSHANPNVHAIGLGEAMCRKYKKLKLGGGQVCDHSGN